MTTPAFDPEAVREKVRAGYAQIARVGSERRGGGRGCCGAPATQTDKLALHVGYSGDELAALPEGANLGLSCGNPNALAALQPGEVVYCVIARAETNEPNRLIAASIGVAIPRDPNQIGYLSEHHCYGMTEKAAGDYSEDLAAQMLATTIGIPFDLDTDYDSRKEQYKVGRQIVATREITQSAEGDKNGLWTTVIASAVLIGQWR